MVTRRKPPQGSGKIYLHFAAITLVAAGLIALASLDGKAPDAVAAVAPAKDRPGAFKVSLTTKTPSHQFDMADGGSSVAAESAGGLSLAPTAPVAGTAPAPAPMIKNAPPPGDPANLIGVKYPSAPASAPAQPTVQQAAQLIAESRARSGGSNQGD